MSVDDEDLRLQGMLLASSIVEMLWPNALTETATKAFAGAQLHRAHARFMATAGRAAPLPPSVPPSDPGAAPLPSSAVQQLLKVGLAPSCTLDELESAYRRAALAAHPDTGGSHDSMVSLNALFERLKAFRGWT